MMLWLYTRCRIQFRLESFTGSFVVKIFILPGLFRLLPGQYDLLYVTFDPKTPPHSPNNAPHLLELKA